MKIAAPQVRDIKVRENIMPDPQDVRNVVADLFLNKDTWEFDVGAAQEGVDASVPDGEESPAFGRFGLLQV